MKLRCTTNGSKLVACFTFSVLIIFLGIKPSNTRQWTMDQALLPLVEFEDNLFTVRNIRNFRYTSVSDYTVDYYDKTFDLEDLESVWYIVEPFSNWKGAAHTFLSFGFKGSEYLSISIEVRKEVGESFSALKGLFKHYEIMYVVGDERDLVALRANHRKDDVFVYPVRADEKARRDLLVKMLERVNSLAQKPEFYNTITNTCTTNLVKHVNSATEKSVPLSFKVLAPGYSDELAYDLGFIDTDLPFDEIRDFYRINERSEAYADSPYYSKHIRNFAQ